MNSYNLKLISNNMRFDILTLFPEIFNIVNFGVIGRAFRDSANILNTVNYRQFSDNLHGHIDEKPLGGGSGMILKPNIIRNALASLPKLNSRYVIHFSPSAPPLSHKKLTELITKEQIIMICTRFRGVDQRAIDMYVDEEFSIGDVVISGGELPALFLIDAICRWLPGVLGNEMSAKEDSFATGLLDYPHFTHPTIFEGNEVPPILLTGHHENIRLWRLRKAMERTKKIRPSMWKEYLNNKLQRLSNADQWQAWQVEHSEIDNTKKPKKWFFPINLINSIK